MTDRTDTRELAFPVEAAAFVLMLVGAILVVLVIAVFGVRTGFTGGGGVAGRPVPMVPPEERSFPEGGVMPGDDFDFAVEEERSWVVVTPMPLPADGRQP
jgi:hypothetical protein